MTEMQRTFLGEITGSRLAVLVDGENIPPALADRMFDLLPTLDRIPVRRVYGDAGRLAEWAADTRLTAVHAPASRNSAEIALTVDAMALALTHQADAFAILSAGGDFRPLAVWLREHGFPVRGLGLAATPKGYRDACTEFHELPSEPLLPGPVSETAAGRGDLDRLIALVRDSGEEGLLLTRLGEEMRQRHGLSARAFGRVHWKKVVELHPAQFRIVGRGSMLRVRLA